MQRPRHSKPIGRPWDVALRVILFVLEHLHAYIVIGIFFVLFGTIPEDELTKFLQRPVGALPWWWWVRLVWFAVGGLLIVVGSIYVKRRIEPSSTEADAPPYRWRALVQKLDMSLEPREPLPSPAVELITRLKRERHDRFARAANRLPLDLRLEERPELVASHPALGLQDREAGKSIVDWFFELVNSKPRRTTLLIVGAPGSGKTDILTELGDALLSADFLVPLRFNLGGWEPDTAWNPAKEPLDKWLTDALVAVHRLNQSDAEWLMEAAEEQIIFLADGLEYILDQGPTQATEALNRFVRERPLMKVVVSCRDNAYAECGEKLKFDAALSIAQLDEADIAAVLASPEIEIARDRLDAIKHALEQSAELRELARRPLWLSLLLEVYRGADSLDRVGGSRNVQTALIGSYVDKKLAANDAAGRSYHPAYRPLRARRWLTWIAYNMGGIDKPFSIHALQPTHLRMPLERLLYAAIACAAVAAVLALMLVVLPNAVSASSARTIFYIEVAVGLGLMTLVSAAEDKLASWVLYLFIPFLMLFLAIGHDPDARTPDERHIGVEFVAAVGLAYGIVLLLGSREVRPLERLRGRRLLEFIETIPIARAMSRNRSSGGLRIARDTYLAIIGIVVLIGGIGALAFAAIVVFDLPDKHPAVFILFWLFVAFPLIVFCFIAAGIILGGMMFAPLLAVVNIIAPVDPNMPRPRRVVRRQAANLVLCVLLGAAAAAACASILLALVAAVELVITSMHDGSMNLPGWRVLGGFVYIGAVFGLIAGLLSSIQRMAIVLILGLRGDIPMQLTKFLRYADRVGLMKKEGRGFVFLHASVQDYFVQGCTTPSTRSSKE
jgi:hypothetical protein